MSVCLSVCLWPLFLDNHWSDLIETCQVYCWWPECVPFQGLILIGQVVPKLWPFIYQTNDRTRCYDVTIDVTILILRLIWRHNWRWGPVDVPFQGLILIGQVVPKLWPFIYQTNDRRRCYDVTIEVTILLLPLIWRHNWRWVPEYVPFQWIDICFWHAVWKFFFFAPTAKHIRPRISVKN